MKSLSFLAILIQSHNQLQGPIPRGGQLVHLQVIPLLETKGLFKEPLSVGYVNNWMVVVPTSNVG